VSFTAFTIVESVFNESVTTSKESFAEMFLTVFGYLSAQKLLRRQFLKLKLILAKKIFYVYQSMAISYIIFSIRI